MNHSSETYPVNWSNWNLEMNRFAITSLWEIEVTSQVDDRQSQLRQ